MRAVPRDEGAGAPLACGAKESVTVNRRMLYMGVALLGVVAVRLAALAQAGQLQEFWADVQVGMAEREQELRTALGLDGTHDLVDAHL